MNDLGIYGKVTAELLDRNGNLKKRVQAKNRLTVGALYNSLAAMLQNPAGLSTLVMSNSAVTAAQNIALNNAAACVLCCTPAPLPMRDNYIIPPVWAKPFTPSVYSGVSFYNEQANTVETPNTLAAIPGRSRMSIAGGIPVFTMEFNKITNSGTVHGVMLAMVYDGTTNDAMFFGTLQTPETPISNMYGSYGFLTVQAENHTTLVKAQNTTNAFAYNLYTKYIKQIGGSGFSVALGNKSWAGLHLNSHYAAITPQLATQTASSYSAQCLYHPSLDTQAATITTTLNAALAPPVIGTLSTVAAEKSTPVVVARPDNNTFEVFMSLEYGVNAAGSGKTGSRLVKAVISDIASAKPSAVSYVECGVIPYVIGCGQTAAFTDANSCVVGYYDVETKQYWLPVQGEIDSGGAYISLGQRPLPGIKLNSPVNGFDALHTYPNLDDSNIFTAGSIAGMYLAARTLAAGGVYVPVRNEQGVSQFACNATTQAASGYMLGGDKVFSAVNLPEPITKQPEDVLRLIYSYSLGNAAL